MTDQPIPEATTPMKRFLAYIRSLYAPLEPWTARHVIEQPKEGSLLIDMRAALMAAGFRSVEIAEESGVTTIKAKSRAYWVQIAIQDNGWVGHESDAVVRDAR